jgi:hypothetical protein
MFIDYFSNVWLRRRKEVVAIPIAFGVKINQERKNICENIW